MRPPRPFSASAAVPVFALAPAAPALSTPVRLALAATVSALLSITAAAPARAQAALDGEPQPIRIEAQALGTALQELARQAGLQLLFAPDLVAGRMAPAVAGDLTPRQAINRLLAGSGLTATVQGQAVVVAASPPAPPSPPPAGPVPGGERSLAPVTVTSSSERIATSEGNTTYAARAASIGKTERALREIPQSVTVITRQQLDDQNAVTLSDALREAAGVTLYGNADGASSFYARKNVLAVQYDGVPGFGSLSSNQFDLSMYDRIEVLRGPMGLLQGSADPSGVVNLVRKRPLKEKSIGFAASVGSWRQIRGDIDANLPLTEDGRLRGRVVLAGENRHFFYDRTRSANRMAYGIVEWDLTPRTTVALSLAEQRSKPTSFGGFPAYNDNGDHLGLPRRTNLDAPWNEYHRDTRETTVDFRHAFNADWVVRGVLRRRDADLDYLNGIPRGGVNRATGLGTYVASRGQYNYENIGADLHLTGKYRAWGRQHSVLIGYNYDRQQYAGGGSSATLRNIDITDLSNHDLNIPGPITSRSGNRTTQSGLYAVAEFRVRDPWTVIIGGRVTDYQNETRAILPTPADWSRENRARARNEFSPYLATVYDLSADFSVYASYADVFVPQTAIMWGGGVVEPRVGWQGELGVKGAFFNDTINASLGIYQIRDENRAIQDPDPTHVGTSCGTTPTSTCSIAAGLIQIRGVDLEVSGQLTPRLQVIGGYTYASGTYLRDATNEGQPYNAWHPKHLFKAWARYELTPLWHLAGGIHAQTRAYSNGYPGSGITGVRQPGYGTTSVQVGRQLSRQVSATLTVNNLFDKTYIDQINDDRSYNYYGEPRSVTLSVRGKF